MILQREKLRRQLKVKIEMAKFLQDTLAEIGFEKKTKTKSNEGQGESKALEFAEFIKKVYNSQETTINGLFVIYNSFV